MAFGLKTEANGEWAGMRGVKAKQQERGAERKHIHFLSGFFFPSSLRREPRNATRNLEGDNERKVDGTVLYCVCVFSDCATMYQSRRMKSIMFHSAFQSWKAPFQPWAGRDVLTGRRSTSLERLGRKPGQGQLMYALSFGTYFTSSLLGLFCNLTNI